VGLIQDENLEAVTSRREDRTFAKVAGVIDTVVAGGVDFDDVERATAIARKLDAARTLATWGVGWALGTVKAASKDASRSGLAATARAREQIRVVYAVVSKGRHQWSGHLRLAD
jgi:hypothetical protein